MAKILGMNGNNLIVEVSKEEFEDIGDADLSTYDIVFDKPQNPQTLLNAMKANG